MKKYYITLIASLLTYYTGRAQNTFPPNGFVGIGTSNPIADLDVKLSTNQHIQFLPNVNGGYFGASGIVCINDSNTDYTPLGFYAANYYFGRGNLGIGTTDTKGYKLAVAGSAIAESVTVKLQSQWPDYVFKSTYKLTPLSTVKAYIDKHQHLPDMPSETEVAKDGVNLGEIVKLQTKKIEELTLYLIEQNKQLAQQKKQLSLQTRQLKQLQQKLK